MKLFRLLCRVALLASPEALRQKQGPAILAAMERALSLYLARYLSDLVWGVSTTSPVNIGLVAIVMLAVATVAAWLPARSASSGEPTRALTGD